LAFGRFNLDIFISSVLFNNLIEIALIMNESHTHIVKYRTYLFVLIALITFTFTSVTVTKFELGHFAITAALLIAVIKSCLVLWHFMHLKYESRVIIIMISFVLFLFLAIMIVLFLDFGFSVH
jgi:cytochrome c oxidase subunit IV